jgi:hypothetical protein
MFFGSLTLLLQYLCVDISEPKLLHMYITRMIVCCSPGVDKSKDVPSVGFVASKECVTNTGR